MVLGITPSTKFVYSLESTLCEDFIIMNKNLPAVTFRGHLPAKLS